MSNRRLRPRRGTIRCEQLERRDCPAAMFSLELPQAPILEGDTPSFTVRLSEPSSRPERVLISTVGESATLGRDYFLRNSVQLLFAPGDTLKTFSIQTYADNLAEGIETFRLVATPTNRPAAQQLSAAVRIWDVVPTSLTVTGGSIVEGNDGRKNATFELTLTGSPLLPVTVQYATQNGTATAGTDYEAATGSLTFVPDRNSIPAPTQYKKTVTVPIIGDRVAEADETFMLVLSNASRGCTLRTDRATFTINNDEKGEAGFQITLTYDNPTLPAVQRATFERAVARIQQIVVGDLPELTVNGTFIDDLNIRVFVENMDPGSNGYALPTAFRAGTGGLPYAGEIRINSARINNPGIYHTIIHEMIHAMGFLPSFFTQTGTISGLGSTQPLFTGANALREYGSIFGIPAPTGVPLYEDVTDTGSYAAHWSTNVFGTEIMSVGWNTASTALRPFSRITAGALDDIGYDVNYAAADGFNPPPDRIAAALDVARRPPPRSQLPAQTAPLAGATASRSPQPTIRTSEFAAAGAIVATAPRSVTAPEDRARVTVRPSPTLSNSLLTSQYPFA
jgi:hypothetical protein